MSATKSFNLRPSVEMPATGLILIVSAALTLAISFLIFASFSPDPFDIWIGVVGGSALLALAFLFCGLCVLDFLKKQVYRRAVMGFVALDTIPSFISGLDGNIDYQNEVSHIQMGDHVGVRPSKALANFIGNPQAVVSRINTTLERSETAYEDVKSLKGNIRISAYRFGQSLVWRLQINERPEYDRDALSMIPQFRINDTGDVLYANAAAHHMIGRQPKTLSDIFSGGSQRVPRNGAIKTVHTNKECFQAHIVLLETQNEQCDMFVLRLENQNGLSDFRFSPMFDCLPVALMCLSAEGKILHANRMALKILPQITEGISNLPTLFEGLGRPIQDWLGDAARGLGLGKSEVVRVVASAPEKYLQVTLGNCVRPDEEAKLLAVFSDVTEHKTLEGQVIQSQKMQAIGQLAGGVAHDFNNLLTAISGHCDLLLLRHSHDDPDYADLIQINQNASRAAALVGQLLAFSRKQTLQPELIDLRDTLADLTHLLNRLVGEKIQLVLSNDPGLLPIRVDKRQLEQVLMNLIVNARDAMNNVGTIKIETKCPYFVQDQQHDRVTVPAGQYVEIKVIDTGCGIPPDMIDRIFEPFVTTKRQGEGTGLGLSMAYGIIKQSGGFIFAKSTLGEGSTFSLYFPAYDVELADWTITSFPSVPDKAALPAEISPDSFAEHVICAKTNVPVPAVPVLSHSVAMPAPAASEQTSPVVLLVEDEASVRAFGARALRMRGYSVIEAECGENALEILQDKTLNIDLFVTDVMMPGMDGPTWVKEALKQRPDIKTVFVSGYAESTFPHDKNGIPNSIFLPKPFSLAQLTQTVQQQLV